MQILDTEQTKKSKPFVSFVRAEAIQSKYWGTEEIYAPKHRKVQS